MTGRVYQSRGGFTLVELSIVLVIIGLIVGGVLVGQDLIRAAGVRATISQIEKYNTAANSFRDKYGYLPGDISSSAASNFGFVARGPDPGEGDGNGVIQGDASANATGYSIGDGEEGLFWVDLSTVRLIDGGFTMAIPFGLSTTNVALLFPAAKLGGGNYIYVWSGGYSLSGSNRAGDSRNFFGLSAVSQLNNEYIATGSSPGLTVQQAYAIDTKVDDGLPQSGNVLALYLNSSVAFRTSIWAAGGGLAGASSSNAPTTAVTAGSSTTCYDNMGVNGASQAYSLEISNGSNVNCALSFKMQAGD